MEWFGRNPVGSIKSSTAPLCGGHEPSRARTGLRPFRVSPGLSQATDLAVTQAVVDEGEKFAGRCDATDLGAPTFSNVVMVGQDDRVAPLAGHRLDGGPAHVTRALLGDVTAAHLDVCQRSSYSLAGRHGVQVIPYPGVQVIPHLPG